VTSWRRHVLVALIGFAAAFAGVVAGRAFIAPAPPVENEVHALLHHALDLDPGQVARIEALENGFAARKAALEAELREDNVRLAAAIKAEHGYGPKVAAAVDMSHHAMGELQKETLQHIFEMRGVLRPDQAEKFDDAVVQALTAKKK